MRPPVIRTKVRGLTCPKCSMHDVHEIAVDWMECDGCNHRGDIGDFVPSQQPEGDV